MADICSCGCQTVDSCSVSSCIAPCSEAEPCACAESDCTPVDPECCTNCNLFVQTTQAFNMPACGNTGSIFLDDASRLAVGSVLYAVGVGYLTVTAILDASEITVRNDCPECDTHLLDPGNPVAEGTQFVVGTPDCEGTGTGGSFGIYLASDYFIPNVGACILIATTGVEGLAIGDTISIGSNRYSISDIPSVTSLDICNNGEGGVPGTLIQADSDSDGIWDYPILRIGSVNPCSADAVDSGSLLVCYNGSDQRKLEGSIDNQVPAWDEDSSTYTLKVMQGLATCVTLASCLTLDPEAEECTPSVIEVSPDTTDFVEPLANISPNPLSVTINGDAFCVTEVVDSTHLRIVPSFEVTEVVEYDPEAVLCIDDCCNQCTPTVSTMDNVSGENDCIPEILLGTGIVVVSADAGIQTDTFPSSLASNSYCGTEEAADGLWEFTINNDNCCDCRKYFEITSNYECAVTLLDPDHFVNVEFRILQTDPVTNSQAFAAMPFVSPRGTITPGLADCDLMPGFETINTYKGVVYDRGFIDPGETATFKGHIRMVSENNTVSALNYSILANWRVWVKVWNYDCADVTVVT